MNVPQFGIFAQGTIAHEFIEFDLRPDVDMALATAALSRLRAPAVSAGGVNLVIGFGSELWRTVAAEGFWRHLVDDLRHRGSMGLNGCDPAATEVGGGQADR